MFMHLIVMVYIFWILIVMKHISTVWMPRDDNTMFMWHCYLGHVGVKCMKKLHNDGLLGSLDFDYFDTCKPCLMGKMTKTLFTGFVE
jgi:hypothetical protein